VSKTEKGSKYRCLLATSYARPKIHEFLVGICRPLKVTVTDDDEYFPQGFEKAKELILTSDNAKSFFEDKFPEIGFKKIKEKIKDNWWLTPKKGGNTPNWDLVSSCTLDNGDKALIIVEAKAHKGELDKSGKKLKSDASADSKANHESIKKAIEEANDGLNKAYGSKRFDISVDKCYQLSNRFAFAWKLAELEIPVILVYLGFINATEMDNYFDDYDDWKEALLKHSKGIIPEEVWNNGPIKIDKTPIHPICKIVDIQAVPDIKEIHP
jgi:hypothetical protein